MTDTRVVRCSRLALMLGLSCGIGRGEALAGGLHHGQTTYVVLSNASPVSFAPAATVQLAPAATVQLAPAAPTPVFSAPTLTQAPVIYQLQAVPMTLQLAPVAQAPVAQAPDALFADAPTDDDVVVMAQGFARSRSSIEQFRAKIREDVRTLLRNPALKKSGQLIVPIALDFAKTYLRNQGFGFVIDEAVEGIVKKFVKRAIVENGGEPEGVEPPVVKKDPAKKGPAKKPAAKKPTAKAVEGVFEIRGRVIAKQVDGKVVLEVKLDEPAAGGHEVPDEEPDPADHEPEEGGTQIPSFTLPVPGEQAPDR